MEPNELNDTGLSRRLTGCFWTPFAVLLWTFKRLVVVIILFVVAWNVWCWLDPADPLVISKETTLITSPVAEDGLPDYTAVMLDRLGRGTPKEENGAILFWETMGTEEVPPALRYPLFDHLGMSIPQGNQSLSNADEDALENRLVGALFEGHTEAGTPDSLRVAVSAMLRRRHGVTKAVPAIVEWVDLHSGALDKLISATQRPAFYSPPPNLLSQPPARLVDMLLPATQESRRAVRSLLRRAASRIDSGKYDLAWEDIDASLTIADWMTEQPLMVPQLVGTSHRSMAFQTIQLWIDNGRDSSRIQHAMRRLQFLKEPRWVAKAIEIGEPMALTDYAVSAIYPTRVNTELDLSNRLSALEPNVMLKQIRLWQNRLADIAREPNRVERARLAIEYEAAIDEKTASFDAWTVLSSMISRDARSLAIANIQVGLLQTAAAISFQIEDRSCAEQRLTLLAAALQLHQIQSGEYPDSFNTLVPQLLETIPQDPFTNQPFRYERRGDGFVLYSLGPNGIDDNASDMTGEFVEGEYAPIDWFGERAKPDGPDDIVVRMPVPKLEVPRFSDN